MAEEILSQEEIDALLHGVDDGEIETESDEDASTVDGYATYDLAAQDRIIRGRMPALELINERFARLARVSVFNLLRRSSEVTVGGVQVFKFSEYINTLYMPTSLNMVRMNPLRGINLFALEAKFVFRLVDSFFGGGGRNAKIEGRDFTPTETRIVQMFLNQIFSDLEEAWKPLLEINFEHVGSEVNPAMANIIGPSDVIVVSVFHVEIDGNVSDFHVSIPYSVLEPIKDVLNSRLAGEITEVDERWVGALRRDIVKASVDVECTVVEKDMTLREVIDLEAGDVISVDIPDDLIMRANGVPIFKSRLGKSRGNLALEVIDRTNINMIDNA